MILGSADGVGYVAKILMEPASPGESGRLPKSADDKDFAFKGFPVDLEATRLGAADGGSPVDALISDGFFGRFSFGTT